MPNVPHIAASARLVPAEQADQLRRASVGWTDVMLDSDQVRSLELLATGAFAPLDGFMTAHACHSVRETGRLPDGSPWPAPVQLAVGNPIEVGHTVALRDAEGDLLAALTVAECVADQERHVVSGRLQIIQRPASYDFAELRLTPAEFASRHAARHVVVTDRPLDNGQVAMIGEPPHVIALQGAAAPGRVDHVTLVHALRAAGVASVTLVPRPPQGAIAPWLPILAANHGAALHPVYEQLALQDSADVPNRISDDALGETLVSGVVPGPPIFDAAVKLTLERQFPPPDRVGITLLFTGLSGSGKSTVAQAVAGRLRATGQRRVTVLDGDLVRTHLSSELGFTRPHRDLNVTRIGFVAAEVTRHGGIAICAPIAPYAATRERVRDMVETTGRFVLIHVATPLDVCERRDRKGLYARARAGLITEFTGISDPYEVPDDAEIVIDTTDMSPGQAADRVEAWLSDRGLIVSP